MASVSSLDQDMRNLRMSRYTPAAAKEIKQWIESTLNETLPSGDLLESLKDGVALCKLANLVLPPPGIKFKASPMPFIQMENISHFLKACEMTPLNLPAHDRFLTVDLYESKDPAQVIQCLGAFSRQAHAAKPHVVKTTIGPKKAGAMSPTSTGSGNATNGAYSFKQPTLPGRSPSPTKMSSAMSSSGARAMSPSLTGGSTGSQNSAKSPPTGPVSSWSNKTDEGATVPAWNIHQYGYMGGASQGNQGIAFGARRQITSQAPQVPSLAEKERMRKQKADEEARLQKEKEEAEQRKRREIEAEDERTRKEEEQRWEEETKRHREEERQRMEEQKRQWAEQERRWKEEEEVRRKEEADLAAAAKNSKVPPEKPRVPSSGVLRGQTLSEYQREHSKGANSTADAESPEQKRVKELEQQLAEARERERVYQAEREERARRESERGSGSRPSTAQSKTQTSSADVSDVSWVGDERDFLRSQWQKNQSQESTPPEPASSLTATQPGAQQRPLPSQPTRPLPEVSHPEPEEGPTSLPQRAQPSTSASSIPSLAADSAPTSSPMGSSTRPLPTPDKEYSPYQPAQNRTDRYLSTAPAPTNAGPRISASKEAGDTSLEQSSLRDSRIASQTKTKAGGWASKSLLEREMERERERQREWEANQAEIKDKPRDSAEGLGAGQTWDVNQYGFAGGDSMNRGSSAGSGIDFGGRRQIMGPREMKR